MTQNWDVRSEQGFMACYRATFAEVYRYAAMLSGRDRDAAEDLVSDVYLDALRAVRRGSLTELSIGYLTIATRHRFLDSLRSAQREERRLRLVSSVPSDEEISLVPALLASLPERERAILVLRYVDDLPMARVAEEMDISTHAAESLAARALKRLRGQEARDA